MGNESALTPPTLVGTWVKLLVPGWQLKYTDILDRLEEEVKFTWANLGRFLARAVFHREIRVPLAVILGSTTFLITSQGQHCDSTVQVCHPLPALPVLPPSFPCQPLSSPHSQPPCFPFPLSFVPSPGSCRSIFPGPLSHSPSSCIPVLGDFLLLIPCRLPLQVKRIVERWDMGESNLKILCS